MEGTPTTFSALEELVFPTCEAFTEAARTVAAVESVSLTITHKSRNTPGKEASQYRGCVVLNCIEWQKGCTFEIKGYGPIEGGWRMRPLQHPGLKKHTVTSWCICDHPKIPLKLIDPPLISTWDELLPLSFPSPDEFIAAATRVSHHLALNLYLLTLMISDGKPKPNGKDTVYIPRGFLTLECVEAGNGCPMAIKAREEDGGWQMRPWKAGSKADLKGAVSTLECKHSAEIAAAYKHRMATKPKKRRNKGGAGGGNAGGAVTGSPPTPVDLHDPDEAVVAAAAHTALNSHLNSLRHTSDADIPSGLDPALMAGSGEYDLTSALSQKQIFDVIEHTFNATSNQAHAHQQAQHHHFPSDHDHLFLDQNFQNAFGAASQLANGSVAGSSSAVAYSPVFATDLGNYPAFTLAAPDPTPEPLSHEGTPGISPNLDVVVVDNSNANIDEALLNVDSTHNNLHGKRSAEVLSSSPASQPSSSKRLRPLLPKPIPPPQISWSDFLTALEPGGQLNPLVPALTNNGGIDPGAVIGWPSNDLHEFVETVAGDVMAGVRIHFRVKLIAEGKRVYDELVAGLVEDDDDEEEGEEEEGEDDEDDE